MVDSPVELFLGACPALIDESTDLSLWTLDKAVWVVWDAKTVEAELLQNELLRITQSMTSRLPGGAFLLEPLCHLSVPFAAEALRICSSLWSQEQTLVRPLELLHSEQCGADELVQFAKKSRTLKPQHRQLPNLSEADDTY